MKTKVLQVTAKAQIARLLCLAAALLAGVLAAAGVELKSPVGTWDFILSGQGQQGIAFLNFIQEDPNGGSFRGYEFITGNNPALATNYDGRNPGGNPGRTGSGTGSTNVPTILYGFTPISGPWEYSANGKILGLFYQVLGSSGPSYNWLGDCVQAFIPYTTAVESGDGESNATTVMELSFCLTNSPFTTNISWNSYNADGSENFYQAQFALAASNASVTITYTNSGSSGTVGSLTNFEFMTSLTNEVSTNATWEFTSLDDVQTPYSGSFTFMPRTSQGPGVGSLTNMVSFTGTVVPGKRFNIVSTPSTAVDPITYSGIPYRPDLLDIAGDWYGTKSETGEKILEFFTLVSAADLDITNLQDGNFTLGAYITNFPTIYVSTNGIGPSFDLEVISMISAHNKIGFHFDTLPYGGNTNIPSDTFGPVSRTKTGARATTRGLEWPGTPVQFNGTLFNVPTNSE